MAGQHTNTLRFVLTQNKPPIPCNTSIKSNSQPTAWPDIESVEFWPEFNLERLNLVVGLGKPSSKFSMKELIRDDEPIQTGE